jgi:hypothetical protein
VKWQKIAESFIVTQKNLCQKSTKKYGDLPLLSQFYHGVWLNFLQLVNSRDFSVLHTPSDFAVEVSLASTLLNVFFY